MSAGRRPLDGPAGAASRPEPQRIGSRLSFRARLTFGLIAGSVIPLAAFGLVLVFTEIARTG